MTIIGRAFATLFIVVFFLVLSFALPTRACAQELGGGVTGENGRVVIGETLSGGFGAPEGLDVFGAIGVSKTADLSVAIGRGDHMWLGVGYQTVVEKGWLGRVSLGITARFGSGLIFRPRLVLAQEVSDSVEGHIGATLLVESQGGGSSYYPSGDFLDEASVPRPLVDRHYLGAAAIAGLTAKVGSKWKIAGEVVAGGGVFKGTISVTHNLGKVRVSRTN